MKTILFLSILALSLLIVQTKEQTQSQFQKNRLASKLAQFHNNRTQARTWPIHGGHGPVVTKSLAHHKMADDESNDELWSWPKFGGHGPVVVNRTHYLTNLKKTDDEAENELFKWPNITKRLPAVVNFTKNFIATPRSKSVIKAPVVINNTSKLINLTKADDELWTWPKFGGHGPIVNFTKNLIDAAQTDDELWSWPKFGGHGPVVVNRTHYLTNLKKADDESNDEFWNWPNLTDHVSVVTNFTKHLISAPKTNNAMKADDELWGAGPVVVKNNTQLPSVGTSKAKTNGTSFLRKFGSGPRIVHTREAKGRFLSF